MPAEILLALIILPLLLIGWAAVQHAWRRHFSVSDAHGDVLASRGNCRDCGCAAPCGSDAGKTRDRRS